MFIHLSKTCQTQKKFSLDHRNTKRKRSRKIRRNRSFEFLTTDNQAFES